MPTIKNIKIEAVADTHSEHILDGQSRICNWLYNHLLDYAIAQKKEFIATGDSECAKTVYTKRGLRNHIPVLKETHHFLKSVHSSPLKNVGLRLSSAIQAHQKSKKGKRKGKEREKLAGQGFEHGAHIGSRYFTMNHKRDLKYQEIL